MDLGQQVRIRRGQEVVTARFEVARHGRWSFTAERLKELPLPQEELFIQPEGAEAEIPVRVDRAAGIGPLVHLVVVPDPRAAA